MEFFRTCATLKGKGLEAPLVVGEAWTQQHLWESVALGTLGLYRGLMLIATGGEWIENLPEDLKALGAKGSFGISPLGWTVAAVAVVLGAAVSGAASAAWP